MKRRHFLVYGALALLGLIAGSGAGMLVVGVDPVLDRIGFRSRLETKQEFEPVATGQAQFVIHPAPVAMPDIAFEDQDGRSHRLSEWRGKTVLLNIWATWCAPCKIEMPALDALQAKIGGAAFTVLALSTDRSGAKTPSTFFKNTNITNLAVYIDDTAETVVKLKAGGLPLSVIVNSEGAEVARLLGPAEWTSPKMITTLKAFIK